MNAPPLRKRVLFGAGAGFAALAIVALLAWSGAVRLPASFTREPINLVIADASQPAFGLVYVAAAKGYFRAEGVDVAFNEFVLGRDALKSVIAGEADLATVYETPVVIRTYEGHDLAIISTLHTSPRGYGLVARRDRGIERVVDLRKRRIGVTKGTSMEYFLTVFLATEGIPATDVIEVPLEPADYEKQLRDGSVDAVVAFNPPMFHLVQSFDPGAISVFYSDVFLATSMLVGRRETVLEKREAMLRFTRAIVKAQAFVEGNREESIQIVVSRLSGRHAEAAIRGTWDSYRMEAKLDHALLTLLTQQGRWVRNTGKFLSPVPDFERAIVTDYLRSATPGAVTLLTRPGQR